MDTVEYSQHVMRIGKNLRRIAEDVESAADNDIDGTERDTAIAKARAVLADYESVVAKLSVDSKVLLAQFKKRFEDDIELITESIARIDG